MTFTLDEAVYDGFYRTIGKRQMSQFIEDLLRPHVLDTALDERVTVPWPLILPERLRRVNGPMPWQRTW